VMIPLVLPRSITASMRSRPLGEIYHSEYGFHEFTGIDRETGARDVLVIDSTYYLEDDGQCHGCSHTYSIQMFRFDEKAGHYLRAWKCDTKKYYDSPDEVAAIVEPYLRGPRPLRSIERIKGRL